MKNILLIVLLFIPLIASENPLNYKLRGKEHPRTGVKFSRLGFPMFESNFNCKLPFNLINASDSKQFKYCSNKLREVIKTNPKLKQQFTPKQLKEIYSKKPIIDKLTWHHHQSKTKRTLQLVDRGIHNKTAHSGGRTIYGGGEIGRKGGIKRSVNIRATKNIFKTSSSIAVKTGLKGVSKGLLAGIAKNIPIIGIGAQIAFDSYVTYQLEIQGEDIKKNKKSIQENRDFIISLQEEQEILDYKITNNTHNINKIINKLFIYKEHFNQIDTQISEILNQVISLENLIQNNKKEIKSITNGAFIHAIDKFDEYYQRESKKNILISEVINSFEFARSIKNVKVSYLINYYLTIARYEQYLQTQDSFDLIKIEENFDGLYRYVENNNQFLNLLNSTYIIIYGVDTGTWKNKLDNITKKIIDKKLKKFQFEEALSIVNKYLITIKSDKKNSLYLKVLETRQKNYDKYKNFQYYEDTKIIDRYSNNLLNEEVIKFLYQNDYYEKALEILRSKSFDDEDLRIEYFIKIFYYLGEKDKLNALLTLIINNSTYSQNIKEFAVKVQKK